MISTEVRNSLAAAERAVRGLARLVSAVVRHGRPKSSRGRVPREMFNLAAGSADGNSGIRSGHLGGEDLGPSSAATQSITGSSPLASVARLSSRHAIPSCRPVSVSLTSSRWQTRWRPRKATTVACSFTSGATVFTKSHPCSRLHGQRLLTRQEAACWRTIWSCWRGGFRIWHPEEGARLAKAVEAMVAACLGPSSDRLASRQRSATPHADGACAAERSCQPALTVSGAPTSFVARLRSRARGSTACWKVQVGSSITFSASDCRKALLSCPTSPTSCRFTELPRCFASPMLRASAGHFGASSE